MLLRILGFWSTTINGFVLPKAMVAPTLLDVADILNLSIHGKELLSLYGTCYVLSTTIGIKFSKDNSEYSKFMLPNAKKNGVISLSEPNDFILMWFCWNFIYMSLVLCLVSIVSLSQLLHSTMTWLWVLSFSPHCMGTFSIFSTTSKTIVLRTILIMVQFGFDPLGTTIFSICHLSWS